MTPEMRAELFNRLWCILICVAQQVMPKLVSVVHFCMWLRSPSGPQQYNVCVCNVPLIDAFAP